MTLNLGALPVAVLLLALAAFEWRGRLWITNKHPISGRMTTERQRAKSVRALQIFAVVHAALAVLVLVYDFD